MARHQWTAAEDRRALEAAAEFGNDRARIAQMLGIPYAVLDNRLTRHLRGPYRAAVESYQARMRAQREITPQMEPNVALRQDGTSRLYQTRGGRPTFVVDLAKLREGLVEDIRAFVPVVKKPPKPDGHLLHVVSPADLHIGKLAWGPETGEDFDSRIAEDRLVTAIDQLLLRAGHFGVKEHLFIVGNDLLQVDNLLSTTTAGTFQDTDSRYRKMFRLAVKLMRQTIERLVQTAPVKVIVVPGNHDQLASFHIGEVLQAIYAGHKGVTISPDLRPRLYHHFGTNLLGFCHGNDEKHPDLPLVMAQENPDTWGQTTCREFLVGHLHKKREKAFTAGDSYNGVRVIVLPSLTGTDSWHARKGYIGEPKASESRLYCPVQGHIAAFTARVQ